jgi:hypothetical protein
MVYKLLPGFENIIDDLLNIIFHKYNDLNNKSILTCLYLETFNIINQYIDLFLDDYIIYNICINEKISLKEHNVQSKTLLIYLTEKLYNEICYLLKYYNSLSYYSNDLIEFIKNTNMFHKENHNHQMLLNLFPLVSHR